MPPDAFPAHGVNEFCDYQSGDPQMEIGTVLLIMISPCPNLTIAAVRPSWVRVSGPAMINSFVRGSELRSRSPGLHIRSPHHPSCLTPPDQACRGGVLHLSA
jgi:hypothetical protein